MTLLLCGGLRYQVVDTPGLLDRPLSYLNEIELQAITALNHVDDVVLLLIDPSEHCGYPLTARTNMFREIEKTLAIPVNRCCEQVRSRRFSGRMGAQGRGRGRGWRG
ncbi:MAG: hypothetical protein U9Q37_02010 [Euryarchaeota archaeon]|nr:hypothetical protein [Euryarchaeota archaeon]